MHTTRTLRWVALTLLVPLLAFAAPDENPLVTQAGEHAARARQLASSPRGVAHLLRLHELRDEVPDLNLLAQTYFDVLTGRGSHPEVRKVARMLLSDLEVARGRLNKSREYLEPLGYVHDFYVLGSFDNEGKSGCNTDFGPEANVDLTAAYPTRHGETHWRKLQLSDRDGYVDLSNVLRPNNEAVAYALTALDANAETRAELSVGASGAWRLWVNGELVSKQDRYNVARPDQGRVSVRLRKGHNRVLLKVCQEQGPFGFYLRQTHAPGALPALENLPETFPALAKGPGPQPQPLPTVVELVAREVQKAPNDAELRGEYATLLHWYRTFDENDRTDLAEAERAADAAPKNAQLQLLAASYHQEDHNLRRGYLTRALQADPASPVAQLAMALHELDREHPERALAILQPLVKARPGFVAARLVLAQTFTELDEQPRSARIVEETFLRARQIPSAVKEAARLSRRMERPEQAMARFRLALALRFGDDDSRRALASLLADTGQVEDSASELRTLLKLSPFDNQTRLRLAELLAGNGRLKEGLAAFAAARELCPEEPELHEREGRTLLSAGEREKAIAAFERSLALRPQNPALREAMRSLQGLDTSYGLQFAFDLPPLSKEAEAFAGEDAVYLADYTYVRVQPSGLSSRFHQLAVKVSTQRGVDAFRNFPISYSPNRQEVQVLKVRITKPDGSVVESFSENDQAMNEPWSGMYYDARARQLGFPQLAAGDVLEVQYRIEDTARENLLSDYWGDVDYVQTVAPKLRYQFIVDMPQSRPLYWNKEQLPKGVTAEVGQPKDGRVLYKWNAKNVSKIVPEPNMPGWAEVATTLHVSTYKTWEDVGRYWWGLVRDQLTPNEELRRTTEKALEGVDRKDQLAVVRAIYDFVVTNTRYVALEFGIHGYKPYRVDRVLARRFGDCKDKASLIHAMLKVAGVDSRLVLLRMRNLGNLDREPASLAAFNHAIVYVPQFQLYLDGTAAFYGASELPTADRVANVLVVNPDGPSQFGTTPEAKAEDNATELRMDVTLGADGSAQANGTTLVKGVHAPDYRRSYQSAASRKATFEQGWAQTFPGLRVTRIDLNDVSRIEEPVQLGFGMEIPRYSEVLPQGLRFHPFGSARGYAQTFAPLVERRYDLVMDSPWATRFAFTYALPPGFSAGSLPPDVEESSPFGHLNIKLRVEDGKLKAEGELALTVARVSAKDYPQFRAFLGRVDQAFARKVMVTRVPGNRTASR